VDDKLTVDSAASAEPAAVGTLESAADIPPIPVISVRRDSLPLILIASEGSRPAIGWQIRPESKGGPTFVVGWQSPFGRQKIRAAFPLTEDGWAQAWQYLVSLDAQAARKTRSVLAARAAVRELRTALADLDRRTLVYVRAAVLIGGYVADLNLPVGQEVDLRFCEEQVLIMPTREAQPLLSLFYPEITDIDVGGPGTVTNFRTYFEAFAGFNEFNRVWSVQTKIQTVLRLELPRGELVFLDTVTAPYELRAALSRQMVTIRAARTADTGTAAEPDPEPAPPAAAGVVAELSKLAALLDAGLLTREEFHQLKSKLLEP
jgi:hypothetical protein